MKLFVWCDPYSVPYGASMVFAIADNLEMAKQEAAVGYEFEFGNSGSRERQDWSGIKLGDPDRVVDLPVAEWHEWSE